MEDIILNPSVVITITSICAGVVGVSGFVLGNNQNNIRERSRVYKHMDEREEDYKDTFQRKDVCSVMHKALTEKMDRVDRNVDKLLQKNGIKTD